MVYFHFFPARDQIAFMRYILEAYDNIGTQSTLPGSTRTTWAVPLQLADEAHALLMSLLTPGD